MNTRIVALLIAATALAPVVAGATVNQPPPGNEPMPQPTPATEVSVVTARGFPTTAVTLAGLFASYNGGGDASLDPVAAAQTTPGSFMPQCGLTASIVLHGGGCKNAIGWYNATEPATVPAQVFPIIPANLMLPPPSGIGCADGDFCPLATRTTTQGSLHSWADPLPAFAAGVRGNPNWSGGKVGFALIGNNPSGSQCTQTKYSQAELNDKSPSGAPWITALIYKSVADLNGYYLAFEDLPTCASSWKGCVTTAVNDGDFNDFVVYITDVACTDGGAGGTTGGGGATGSGGTTGAGGTTGSGGTTGRGGTTGGAGTTGIAGTTGAGGMTGAAGTSGTAGTSGEAGISGAGGSAGGEDGGTTSAAGATGTGGAGASGHPDGTEGGACYGNGTCNTGLICLSHLCVQPPDAGTTTRRVGGCGCEAAGLSGAAPGTLLMLGCALVVAGRRRAKRTLTRPIR